MVGMSSVVARYTSAVRLRGLSAIAPPALLPTLASTAAAAVDSSPEYRQLRPHPETGCAAVTANPRHIAGAARPSAADMAVCTSPTAWPACHSGEPGIAPRATIGYARAPRPGWPQWTHQVAMRIDHQQLQPACLPCIWQARLEQPADPAGSDMPGHVLTGLVSPGLISPWGGSVPRRGLRGLIRHRALDRNQALWILLKARQWAAPAGRAKQARSS